MNNKVQLIAYADRLSGGGLPELQGLLDGPLRGVFGGLHILPFFLPIDGADAGFDPIDHTRIDPRLGDWSQMRALGGQFDIMADLIVNHMSSLSPQFQDFWRQGDDSPYAGMFLTLGGVFPGGATEAELLKIYRPRLGLPFTVLQLRDGRKRVFWTTFTPEQIDIDVKSPQGAAYLQSILDIFSRSGVRAIRLDAVGYAIKKPGSSCFMIPETFDFIGQLTASARARGLEVLVEIHSHFESQIEIAKHVDRVYDFALPPLVLHALFKSDGRPLCAWLERSPRNAVTVLDTHDGIGVRDVGADGARPGLLAPSAIDEMVETIHRNSGGQSRKATGASASNLDLYQVNCTYYDALGRDDRSYLVARAIQFFAPGIPQVYYVGLLAGTNDMDLLSRSGTGRDINRHYYSAGEVTDALGRPVVQNLLDLIRFRNSHPAFGGAFRVLQTQDHKVGLEWRDGDHWARLDVDLRDRAAVITCSSDGGEVVIDPMPRCGSIPSA